jgi:hypothetical protein
MTKNLSRPTGWRARHAWRRAARRIVAEYTNEVVSQLHDFRGQPICGLTTSAAGTVRLILPGWSITVVEVTAPARAALTAAVDHHQCYLSDAGRYGPFWWVAIQYHQASQRRPTVILGARLLLTPIEDGDPGPGSPDTSPLLAVS